MILCLESLDETEEGGDVLTSAETNEMTWSGKSEESDTGLCKVERVEWSKVKWGRKVRSSEGRSVKLVSVDQVRWDQVKSVRVGQGKRG